MSSPAPGPEDNLADVPSMEDYKKGELVTEAIRWRFAEPQKGRHAQPAELSDPRMRQALLMKQMPR